ATAEEDAEGHVRHEHATDCFPQMIPELLAGAVARFSAAASCIRIRHVPHAPVWSDRRLAPPPHEHVSRLELSPAPGERSAARRSSYKCTMASVSHRVRYRCRVASEGRKSAWL